MSTRNRVHDSTDLLTLDELTAIRKNYYRDDTALQNLALRAAASVFADGRAFVMAIGDLLYGQAQPTDFIEPLDREVQLLAIFTISRQPFELAVHCYWSILIGMSPHDVAGALFVASMSGGISAYVAALGVFTKVMQMLKKLAPTEPTPEDVLGALERAF